MGERALDVERVLPVRPVVIEIEPECLRVRSEKRDLIRVRQRTVYHRCDGAKPGIAAPKILLQPADEIAGERLDFERLVGSEAGRTEVRVFPGRERIHYPDGYSFAGPSRNFSGPEDRCRIGGVHEVGPPGDESCQLRGPSDAPRVNQAEAGDVAAEKAAEAARREVLRIRNEEGALF